MLYSYKACIILPIIMFSFTHQTQAQRLPTNEDSAWYKERIAFITQAPGILSTTIKEKNWNDLRNFAANWKLSESPSDEIIIAIQIMNEICSHKFFVMRLPGNYMQLLETYAREMDAAFNKPRFRYYINLSGNYRYDATNDVVRIFRIFSIWSLHIQSSDQLSKTEVFFCDVFAGKIRHPMQVINNEGQSYPDLAAFNQYIQSQITNCDSITFTNTRNSKIGTAGLMLGSWIPTGKATLFGSDLSFGFLCGFRNKKNEYDLLASFRIPHTSNQYYSVLRSDSLFTSHYYDGAYFGFDYTRYVVRKLKYEIGFTSAIGYDFFDFTSQSGDSLAGKNISPIAIGSFDFSNGLRFKYFLRPGLYIGLSAKYHFINYCNTGGTDVSGNAFTIDLILGSH